MLFIICRQRPPPSAGVFACSVHGLCAGRDFLISINAPAPAFGFIQPFVRVTGSSRNGYGGRVVLVPATFFDARRCPCKTVSIRLATCSPMPCAGCSWAIEAADCTIASTSSARGAGRRSNGSAVGSISTIATARCGATAIANCSSSTRWRRSPPVTGLVSNAGARSRKSLPRYFPGGPRAADMDRILHGERLDGKFKRLHWRKIEGLPDGTTIVVDGSPVALRGKRLLRWTPRGYNGTIRRPRGVDVAVLTPPSIIAVLKRGYRPFWHPSAD